MIEIVGAAPAFARLLRSTLASYPAWYVNAARISKVVVTSHPDVRSQLASYQHDSRILYVYPGIGSVLQKAIGHELAHGIDDNFGAPHYFSSSGVWLALHRGRAHFDSAKYAHEALEYFADMFVKFCLLGPTKLSTTHPAEVQFFTHAVIPLLQKEFPS